MLYTETHHNCHLVEGVLQLNRRKSLARRVSASLGDLLYCNAPKAVVVTVVDTFLIIFSGIPSVTIWLSTVRGFSWQALRPTAVQHAAKKWLEFRGSEQ